MAQTDITGSGLYLQSGASNQLTCSFIISGEAKFENASDIYIKDGLIQIAGPLASSGSFTITPAEYTDGTQILALTDNSSTTLEAEYEKFTVTSSTTVWYLTSEGVLRAE